MNHLCVSLLDTLVSISTHFCVYPRLPAHLCIIHIFSLSLLIKGALIALLFQRETFLFW